MPIQRRIGLICRWHDFRFAGAVDLTPKHHSPRHHDQPALLNDVAKVYLTETVETRALREVHFEVQRGEWVAIVGPSGYPAQRVTSTPPTARQ